MSSDLTQPTRVFISYSHDSDEHKDRVLELSNRLRSEGLDCHIDQYETSPAEGWPRWMQNQIGQSDSVLVVCTNMYEQRFLGKGEVHKGLGGKWEGAIITQELYSKEFQNTKFIPVLFSSEDASFIPDVLKSATYYRVDVETGYEDLYRRLTDQRAIVKPELGQIRALPPRERKKAATETPTNMAEVREKVPEDDSLLILLRSFSGDYLLVAYEKIEVGDKIKIYLTPSNPRESAFIANLRKDSRRSSISIAYGLTALQARIDTLSEIRQGGKEVWLLELQEEKSSTSTTFLEVAFANMSVDDIAELRAKRILLNESLLDLGISRYDTLNSGMLEQFIQGSRDFLPIEKSPLPSLYQKLRANLNLFIATARLYCVLYLRLSHTVEHILQFDLQLKNEDELNVKSKGSGRKLTGIHLLKL